jgi:hypothetical protein
MSTTAPVSIFVLSVSVEGTAGSVGAYTTRQRAQDAAATYREEAGWGLCESWVFEGNDTWIEVAALEGDDAFLSITEHGLDAPSVGHPDDA